jgi:hypothetical protein
LNIIPKRKIYCIYCAEEIFVHQLQCPNCGKWLRSFWPYLFSFIVFILNFFISTIFLWKLVPTVASALANAGRRFSFPVRFFIASSNFISNWYWIIFPLVFIIGFLPLIYLLIFYKPERNYGGYTMLTLALLSSMILTIVFITTLYDVVCLLPFILEKIQKTP